MEIIIYLAAILYALNAIYYFVGIHRLIKKPEMQKTKEKAFISLIIPARNEENNIRECLSAVELQDLPLDEWEVWIVDDQSTDETGKIADEYAKNNSNFQVIHTAAGFEPGNYKKQAVLKGIEKSAGDIIVTTDADCVMAAGWLRYIREQFDSNTGMVVGIPVYRFKNTPLELYQALDYASLSTISVSLVANGTPLMCSAANMAYRKETFKQVNGFDAIDHFISGDDDLLLQKVVQQKKWEIRAVISPSSFTYTKPVESWKKVLEQRARWGSKGAFYPLRWTRVYLAIIFAIQLFLAGGFLVFSSKSMLIAWAVKLTIDLVMTVIIIRILGNSRLIFGFLFVSIGQPFVIVISAVRGFLGKFSWKQD